MSDFHTNELDIPLASKFFLLYKTTYQYLKRFPKKARYSLGEKLENSILELMKETFYLNQLPNILKEKELLKLNAGNELLKRLFRLAHEIAVLDEHQYLTIQSHLHETGKMIGGWIKFIKTQR
ncbi:MAG: four helix bundle protein [Parcubacteria group bacterium]